DAAAVAAHDRVHDPQAEAGTVRPRGAAEAAVTAEEARLVAGGQAGTLVFHDEHRVGALARPGDAHARTFGRELVGVAEQVEHHLQELRSIADDPSFDSRWRLDALAALLEEWR